VSKVKGGSSLETRRNKEDFSAKRRVDKVAMSPVPMNGGGEAKRRGETPSSRRDVTASKRKKGIICSARRE